MDSHHTIHRVPGILRPSRAPLGLAIALIRLIRPSSAQGLGRADEAGQGGVAVASVGHHLVGPGLDDRESSPIPVTVHHIRAWLAGQVVGDDRHVHG